MPSKFWKKINNPMAVVALAAVAVIFLLLLVRQFKTRRIIDQQVADLQNQADVLQKNNDQLQGFISYFQTTSYSEKVAREQLSVKKPGETVYSFSTPPVSGNGSGSDTTQQSAGGSSSAAGKSGQNAAQWWQYFFR